MLESEKSEQPVSTIMTTPAISVESNETLRTVIEKFVENAIGFVVVLGGGSVAGVVSEHDVLQAIHDGADMDEVWAADVMSTDLVTIDGSATIADAAHVMASNNIRHLPVIGNGGAVLSIRDIVRALIE